jgi:hypothetical protein
MKALLVVFKENDSAEVEAIARVVQRLLKLVEGVADVRLLDSEPDADLAVHLRTDAIWRERLQKMLSQADSEERWAENRRASARLGKSIKPT